MGNSIQFAGHIISDGGIRPDDDKFAALREFKQPVNVKELQSFLGLVAQFGAFAPLYGMPHQPPPAAATKGNALGMAA